MAGPQVFELSFAAFQGSLAGIWIRGGATRQASSISGVSLTWCTTTMVRKFMLFKVDITFGGICLLWQSLTHTNMWPFYFVASINMPSMCQIRQWKQSSLYFVWLEKRLPHTKVPKNIFWLYFLKFPLTQILISILLSLKTYCLLEFPSKWKCGRKCNLWR